MSQRPLTVTQVRLIQSRQHASAFRCPECGEDTTVYDSRRVPHLNTVRRRRVCPNGHRFSTREVIMREGDDPRGVRFQVDQARAAVTAALDNLLVMLGGKGVLDVRNQQPPHAEGHEPTADDSSANGAT